MRILLIFITLLTLTKVIAFAQDENAGWDKFKNLKDKDSLIIDYMNTNCRVTSGDKLLIYRIEDGFKILRFIDFHTKLTVNDIELNDYDKQRYRQSHADFETIELTTKKFYELLKYIENVINYKHDDCIVIAGFYSELTIQLDETIITHRFRCPIEMKTLGGIEMKNFRE